ncbi:MAG TPA: pyridoxal phosphate-dependent aminotransferase [Acidimicrobiia bacterium]|nr:pyridoxal phosphate-dependent aminotransferase [Acidimicrobiia bacterium]
MSGVSQRLEAVTPSATMAITARAAELRAQGEAVIGFGAGEPDFPTPEHIVEAALAAVRDVRNHKYSPAPGLPELREAVAAIAGRDAGYDVSPSQVIITPGGKGAVYATFQALIDPGDEVLLPAPYWVSYPEGAKLAGGVPVAVPATVDAGFKVTVDQLEAARTERTKMLVFCSPSNPTGALYSAAETAAIGRWAAEHGIWVMSDEIYQYLVYGGAEFSSLPVVAPEAAERTVVVHGVAKTFAMTGWRVGWAIAPEPVAKAIGKLQSHSTSNVANVSQRAAIAALTGPMDPVWEMRKAFDRRRRIAHEGLSQIPGLVVPEPEGAFYVFPSVEGQLGMRVAGATPTTSMELAAVLLDEAKIAVVPGEAFGAPGSVRLSYALGDDDLIEGIERWAAAVG